MKPWMKKLRNWFGLCQEEDERHINFLGICLDNLFYKKKKKWETNGEETWKQKGHHCLPYTNEFLSSKPSLVVSLYIFI
jgi:hypothetical protein